MNLFADYIHPLTDWLQMNPSWALFFTFIIALAESLAIIGSIIPGSVTMTAVGILAGSGVLRIDLTLLSSSLGAVCGDSLSYALGYFYSEKLVEMWPFKKYPSWLTYGKNFFSRHGGKSVLIGRFVGPLRSIIPVIAGITHMKHWRFLIANIVSAIGWSLLYVMPGVLIGAAGHELSAETATRLFVIILILLLSLWIVSLGVKWGIIKLHSFFKNNLHGFWVSFKKYPLLTSIYTVFTPKNEINHYTTAGLILLTLFCFFASLSLISLNLYGQALKCIDLPVYLFLQSFHTNLLEAFFIVFTQLTSKITVAVLYLGFAFWLISHKRLRAVIYLSVLVILNAFVGHLLSQFIYCPRPQGLAVTMAGSSFPNASLLVATALYGFIFYYINNKYSLITNTLRTFILVLLGLSGMGAIYLGDNWLSDILAAYFIGAFTCLITCLFYRKENTNDEKKSQSVAILVLLFITIVFSTSISVYLNFKTLVNAHTPYQKEYTLKSSTWWEQQQPILPLYRLNRVGKRTSLLNIQYSGDLSLLASSLEEQGWVLHNETLFAKLLMRVNNLNPVKLPLLTQLYQNKSPELIMTYKDKQSKILFQLIIWASNYNFNDINQPLWIGTLYPTQHELNAKPLIKVNSLSYLIPALKQFNLRKVTLPNEVIKTTLYPADPDVLLIKNHENTN